MSEQHTPEPWRVGRLTHPRDYETVHETVGPHEVVVDTDEGVYVLAGCNYNFPQDALANARRIVACVNACEDILDYELSLGCVARLSEQLRTVTKQRDELLAALHNIRALNPMLEILDERRRLFVISNNFELKYLPIYADQPDPTYVVKWVWEVRNQHGSSVAEAHEWLYQAIDNAELAAIASVKAVMPFST